MSVFKVNVMAVNPKSPEKVTPPLEVLVDTGAELTWLPRDLLLQIAIEPVRKRAFITATKQIIQREVGYETIDEVVFAESGDMNVLGVRLKA